MYLLSFDYLSVLAYRNWMNSMGVMPYVNWLYSDLADGLIIFQLYDIIKPGIVNWGRVHRFVHLLYFMCIISLINPFNQDLLNTSFLGLFVFLLLN